MITDAEARDREDGQPTDIRNLNQPDDHAGPKSGPRESEKVGHEADYVNVKVLVYSAVVMLVTGGVVYGAVTAMFAFLEAKAEWEYVEPNPVAAERNNAPTNERLNRLGRRTESEQPRLEGLVIQELDAWGNGEEPEWVQTRLPKQGERNNSPAIYPEDILPQHVEQLGQYSWADRERGKVNVPVDKAIEMAAKKVSPLAGLLKARGDAEPARKSGELIDPPAVKTAQDDKGGKE